MIFFRKEWTQVFVRTNSWGTLHRLKKSASLFSIENAKWVFEINSTEEALVKVAIQAFRSAYEMGAGRELALRNGSTMLPVLMSDEPLPLRRTSRGQLF